LYILDEKILIHKVDLPPLRCKDSQSWRGFMRYC